MRSRTGRSRAVAGSRCRIDFKRTAARIRHATSRSALDVMIGRSPSVAPWVRTASALSFPCRAGHGGDGGAEPVAGGVDVGLAGFQIPGRRAAVECTIASRVRGSETRSWEAINRLAYASRGGVVGGRRRQSPYWNPYSFSGYPGMADIQTLVYYPPAVLLRLAATLSVHHLGWRRAASLGHGGGSVRPRRGPSCADGPEVLALGRVAWREWLDRPQTTAASGVMLSGAVGALPVAVVIL